MICKGCENCNCKKEETGILNKEDAFEKAADSILENFSENETKTFSKYMYEFPLEFFTKLDEKLQRKQ